MRFWPLRVVDVGVEDSFGKSLATVAQLFPVWQQIGNVWSQFILTWLFTASFNSLFGECTQLLDPLCLWQCLSSHGKGQSFNRPLTSMT